MEQSSIIVQARELPVSCREFEQGAKDAAQERGITVIIDNFRASNTILALLDAGAEVTPVETTEQALSYNGYIKMGEENRNFDVFDYDNSPMIAVNNPEIFKGQNVVIRTTNGTRGLINAIGSKNILVGSFRNFDRVIDYCLSYAINKVPVSFVAMGSLRERDGKIVEISRIEDLHCAKMMFYSLVSKLKPCAYTQQKIDSDENPWNNDWKSEVIEQRPLDTEDGEDRRYSLQLNASKLLPYYDHYRNLIRLH